MTDHSRDVFDEADAEADEETGAFSAESPSTAVYLHQVKSELNDDWYQQEHKTERIGAYKIKGKLGEGGMAQVYRAEQMSSDREVAVKVVSLKGGTRNDMAQQVFREASALAMIDHPNVISCFGFGEDKGRMYMALEILDGKDSHDLIEENGNRPLSLDKIFDISMQAIAGFQMVYKAGFIHRDIKPANIFVNNDGVVKVADLGLAWKGADVSMENMKSGALGTPSFMSPEQIIDEVEIDVRSDIYSMGATIFFYATGRTPFSGDDPMAIMKQALNEEPPSMRSINPSVPEALDKVVHKCMQKDRDLRYASWKELYSELELVRDGKEPVNTGVLNEAQELARTQAIAATATKKSSNGFIVGIFVLVVITVLGIVIAKTVSAAPDDETDAPVETPTAEAPVFSVFDLYFVADGEAVKHKDYISLNGGMLRCDDTTELIQTLKKHKYFSVELILTPANCTQGGPARILTFSQSYAARNFTVAQEKDAVEVRVRSSTALSGLRPRFVAAGSLEPNRAHHLLFVRDSAHHILYLNGQEVLRTKIYGHIGNWVDSFPLLLGSDIEKSAPWHGTLHKLDFICTALSKADAEAHYKAWSTSQ